MARNDFQSNYLAHHGILGMKWGIRRYQNDDGSLTPAGRERYGVKEGGDINDISSAKGIKRRLNDVDKAIARNKYHRGKALAKVNTKSLKSSNTKNATKAEKHSEMIRKGEQETERLLSKAEKMGYSVKSSFTVRNVSSGKEIIARTLLGSALATGMLLPFGRIALVPGKPSLVGGKKYNVKESKETTSVEKGLSENKAKKQAEDGAIVEQKARAAAKKAGLDQGDNWKVYRDAQAGDKKAQDAVKKWESEKKSSSSKKSSGLSEKTIKSRVEYAKNTGKFDMEFLERIDRYVDEENHSQAEVLKGYEKYLKEHGDEFYKKK